MTLVLLAVALVASSARADFPGNRAGTDRELRPDAAADSGMHREADGSALTGAPEVAPLLTAMQAAAPVERSWPSAVEGALRSHEMGLRPLNGQLASWYHDVVAGEGNEGPGVSADSLSGPFTKLVANGIEIQDEYRTPVPAPGAVLLGALGLGLVGGIRNKKHQSN